jgi:hypothetical protein
MKAEILERRPLSGTYPECWYEAKDQYTYVLFEDDLYEKWLGVFGNGRIVEYHAVVNFPTTTSLMVVGGGKGYVVDGNTRELHYQTECDYLSSAHAIPAKDLIIACDFTGFYAFSSEKQLWQSGRIASDGIDIDVVSAEEIAGRLWLNGFWRGFKLQLENFSVEIGRVIET